MYRYNNISCIILRARKMTTEVKERKPMSIDSEMNLVLELVDKDFKTVAIKMFQQAIVNILKQLKKLSKDIEVINKSQRGIVQLNKRITEIKLYIYIL